MHNQRPNGSTDNAAAERFTKANDQLIGLGLPPRLVLLYGKIAYHAKSGKCFTTHQKLAEELGLASKTSREHVLRLLRELRRLGLIEWKRGRYYNLYRVLDPDPTFLSGQIRQKSHISDPTKKSHRKEIVGVEKKVLKEASGLPASRMVPQTDGLAGLLTQSWNHLAGAPGPKLLVRVAAILTDIPVEQFHELLVSRRKSARSFGLAEQLAASHRVA